MPDSVRGRIIEQVNVLLTAANSLSIPVMVTEQYPKGLGPTETELKHNLQEDALLFEKTVFSCFKASDFAEQLANTERKQVILTGMETHICVLQTAMDLLANGYQVHIIEDAVCSRAKTNQYNALQRLREAGVIISNVESVLFEWLADAKHPDFKALSKLIV
jgi:nicotinamidase-related amidase